MGNSAHTEGVEFNGDKMVFKWYPKLSVRRPPEMIIRHSNSIRVVTSEYHLFAKQPLSPINDIKRIIDR